MRTHPQAGARDRLGHPSLRIGLQKMRIHMHGSIRIGPILVTLILSAHRASASFWGYCPSLHARIAQSSLIVVAQTIGYPTQGDAGGFYNFKIQVEHVLKGEEKRKELVVRMRFLPPAGGSTALDRGTGHNPKWLIFLNDRKRFDEQYSALNCSGAILGVAPTTDYSSLSGKSPHVAIEILLKDFVSYEADEQRVLKQQVDELLASP